MFFDKILKKRKNETYAPETHEPVSEFEEPKTREFHEFARDFSRPEQTFSNLGFEREPQNFFKKDLQEKRESDKKEIDKTDLILQKLETIEARLKLIEEKMEKRTM